MLNKGRGINHEEQWKMMYDLYHGMGMEGNLSHIHFLLSRHRVFEDLLEHDPTFGSFHLKLIYSCQSGTPIVMKVGLTTDILAIMTFKSTKMANGRTLTRTADKGIKVMKKA